MNNTIEIIKNHRSIRQYLDKDSSINSYDEQMTLYLKEIGRYDKEKNWSSRTSEQYKINYYPKVKATMEKQGFSTK